jgi:hypothetical protein
MQIRLAYSVVPLGMLVLLAACGPSGNDIKEIREQQKLILAKLNDLERKIEARPAVPQPARAQLDPNKVYNIPIGNSPFKGAKDGRVIVTDFSDFQ